MGEYRWERTGSGNFASKLLACSVVLARERHQMRFFFAVAATLALVLTPNEATAARKYCPFSLRRVLDHLVRPEIQAKLGARAADLTTDDPILFQSHERLEVILGWTSNATHSAPLDADDFVIIVDTCKFKVLRSGFISTIPSSKN